MTGHQCSAFPKRRALGMVWRCGYCGQAWMWRAVLDSWGDRFMCWERYDLDPETTVSGSNVSP